ncbi:hypothetical protein GCM10009577_44510 [Streptomyces javensis]
MRNACGGPFPTPPLPEPGGKPPDPLRRSAPDPLGLRPRPPVLSRHPEAPPHAPKARPGSRGSVPGPAVSPGASAQAPDPIGRAHAGPASRHRIR